MDPEKMEGVVNGCLWFGVTDCKPVFLSRFNPLPPAADDQTILPFWQGGECRKIFDVAEPGYMSPAFEIQHLCGYGWTPENYKAEAAKLESYGFECLRSRRGADGRYSEIWRLPGWWCAKGKLRDFADGLRAAEPRPDDKTITDRLVSWLCERCSFGTLDVTVQRAAMPNPD